MSSAVKKVAQVAIGAAIGFIQGGPWGAVAGAAMAFYVASQQDKLDTGSLRSGEPSSQTLRSSKAAARYVLGRVSTGGVLAWGQEQAGDQTDGEWLHMVYVLSEGEIDALEQIFLGEEVVQAYGEHASYELVTNPTQVNAFLKANSPDWRDTQIGRGLSFVRLSFRYSAEKYPSGIPDVRFVLRGRRDIYDPRTRTTGYSENTALHILWFLRNRCGVPDDEIVFSSFANSASVCDEMLANADGSTSARYRSGCVIGADESRTQVMQKLEAACGGKLIRVGGRWMLQVGAYYGPYDFEITEDMVVGTVTGSTEPTNDSAINTVRGTFVDPSQAWAETDYPEVSVSQWVVADGGEAAETLSFSYVSNPYQAQRLANIELRRRRAGGTLSIPMNFMGYNCRPGRSVKVNLPSLNIVGEFVVTDWSMSPDSGCNVSVAQNEPAIFDDAVGQPYNPIGFISMPTGGLGSPTGLTWSTEDNAEVVQGTLAWVAPNGVVTGYAITVRQGTAAVQAQQVPATTLKLPLSGLPSGNYTMSVAALGPLTRSGEASITVSIDGPPIPESCVVQATIDTITLIPGNTLHGLNGGTYEYFFSTNPQATQGEYLGQGLSLTHTGLAFATNYAYFVRSKNAYGVSAFLKVVASTSTDMENMLGALKDKIESGQLAPVLRQEIALISGPPTQAGSVAQRIAAEATARGQAIAAEATARGQAIAAETAARNQAIATEVVDRNKAIAVETQARTKVISDESAARAQGLLSEAQARGAAITSEAQARQSADESLTQKIETVTASAGSNAAAIQAEATTRANADSAMGQKIDAVAASTASNAAAISNETTARTTADAAMASQIASLRAESGGFDSTLNYGFSSTVEGWAGTRCTLTVENGRLVVTNDAAGAYLSAPLVAIKGRDHDRIRCRITRRAGSGWTGQVTYTTAAHGSSTSYNKVLPNPGLAVGQTMVLEWDMSQLTNGGSDWSDSTITRFYLWISGTAGDVFEIDWIAVGQIAPSASVASVVDERNARISGDEANASAVTALGSSLTTTNQNVTAAQQAAQDAAALAGGKGKVLVQAAAPAVADRLAQNLWIDTTGNANTPKRWNGTAWSAVTDKVATDAAAAAQSALSQLAGKADASALQALSTTVTNQGNTLSSQGNSITELNSSLQTTNGNVATAQQAAQAASTLAGSKGKVLYQSAAPAVADRQAENLWIDTTGAANTPKRWNGSAWLAVTDKVATDAAAAAASALAQVANKADASALQALNSTVSSQGNTLTSQGNALTGLQASFGALAGNGANLLSDEYSWLTSTTLPAMNSSASVTRVGVAVPEADSGFGLQVGGFTTAGHYLMLSPTNNAAGYNVRIEPGVYLVSLYIRGSAAGSMRARLFDGTGPSSTNVPYTTTRTRITLPITVTGSTRAAITLYLNQTVVADLSLVIDSVMIEKRIGESNTPSPFMAGPSARAAGALALANQALDVRVTQAESGLSSTSAAVTTLGNSLQTTNGNVTTAQQAAQAAADLAGSKGKVLYQTATPAVADRQAENLWIDTTGAANTPKRWNGSAWVAVTDKVATDAAAAAQSALTQLASKADASALQTLQSTVTSQGNTINSQGSSLVQLKASLSQQPDNLVLRGTFEDGLVDPWTGNPGIAGLTAHPSAGKAIAFYANSFCGTGRIIVSGGEQIDMSADVYRAYMTAGQTGNFQLQFFDKTDASLGYFNAFTFSAGGAFQTFSGRLVAPAAAVSARFVTRIQPADGTGRSLWCNIVARRVTAADAANGEAISTLGTTVTQQGTTLTSQGQSLLSLTNRMTDAEGVNSAQATAISQMDTTVKQQGTAITAAASRLDGLYVQVNPEMEGDSSAMAGATGSLVGVWTEQSARVEEGIAMGRQVETVQAQVGEVGDSVQAVSASVQQVSETIAGVDGRVSAISSWKTETNSKGKKVATGIVQGSDGTIGEILLSADRVAIINGLEGAEASLFVFQNGQLFLNSALINQAFIQNLIVGMTLKSQAVNSQGLPLIELNMVTGAFNLRGQEGSSSTLINNGGVYVYDNGIRRTAVGNLSGG